MGEKRVGEKDLRFIPVASSGGVNIFASAGGLVSFANSPYYAHEHGQAVDIYPLNPEAVAFSPIRGDLLEVFTVKSPRPRYFQAAQEERLLIVRPSENPNLVARILHTESLLEKGARLSVGTPLGRIARSGFYNFWTEYHVHVEARNPSHLLRAKGSLQMEPLTSHSGISGKVPERPPSFRVAESNENYTLVEPEEGAVVLGPLRGLSCRVGQAAGILDAGVPHYRFGGVHMEPGVSVDIDSEVSLWGTTIGKVVEPRAGLAIFRSLEVEIRVNAQRIRGLSFYPWVQRNPLLKLIPPRPSWMDLRNGEEVEIRVSRTCSGKNSS